MSNGRRKGALTEEPKQSQAELDTYEMMGRQTAILRRERDKYKTRMKSLGYTFDRHGIMHPPKDTK